MKIFWKTEKLKKTVENYARSNKITAMRMQSISAASCFLDLKPQSKGRAHFLQGPYKGCFALDLEKKSNGKRIICIPKGDFKKEDNIFIEASIVELEIIDIEDYHN